MKYAKHFLLGMTTKLDTNPNHEILKLHQIWESKWYNREEGGGKWHGMVAFESDLERKQGH